MDQFEAYFRRADLDQDGKISGAEAVGFFQGSNLPKQVLAQIWMHADQNHTGFLSRQEFFNALKLVTVAQSKRELTPEIVKAAIYGPASARIPPPQINLAAVPGPQVNATVSAPQAAQVGGVSSVPSQSVGFRGPVPPNVGMRPQYLPSQGAQTPRPLVPTSTATAPRPSLGVSAQGYPRAGSPLGSTPPSTSISNDWLGGVSAGSSVRPVTGQVLNKETTPAPVPVPSKVQDPMSTSSLATTDAKLQPDPGSTFTSGSMFGGDAFSAVQRSTSQPPPSPANPGSSPLISSAGTPKGRAPESSAATDPFAALRSTYTMPSTGSLPHQTQPAPRPNQQPSQVTTSYSSSGMAVGGVNSTTEQSQPWPKMTHPGIQKYAKVFGEVDTDRDGKISGEQARNLFLSWRLPREILKQVWDLSDQDNDSMLSLREFCVALYLMERYREGRTLPSALPSSIMLDDTLMSLSGPPAASYGSTGWGPNPGPRPQSPQQGFPGPQPLMHTGVRLGMQPMLSQADGRSVQVGQQNARGPLAENFTGGVQSNGELKGQGASDTENKVENKENLILDYKEKLEYYRSKMQDLVLYKSRCDNRLNEITERARADKHEAESLGKKYEEKYKQVAEIASKLTIEEGTFRDTQERKMELQQAITKMEQGGSADGILQVRADRIQSDLEELLKALAERCKKHGVLVKSAALIELPPGWQPGIPEIAAVWDEEWDKFEDEGFSNDVSVSVNSKMPHENEASPPDLMSDGNKSDSPFSKGVSGFGAESLYSHSEVGSESPRSLARQVSVESPSQEYSDNHFRKSFDADSDIHGGFDESSWGFDNNDDVDSVWGFSAKSDDRKQGEQHFFDSSEFGGSPTRSEISQVDHSFQRNTRFAFEDSVPGSPISRAGNSPRDFSSGVGNSFFDSSSRFDSFSQQDNGSPRGETFTRFDSMNSTRSFDQGRGYSFDDADPFGSSGPFKVSTSDSQTPKKSSDNWSSF